MFTQFYPTTTLDLERIGKELEETYQADGFKTQRKDDGSNVIIQLKKEGFIPADKMAITVLLQQQSNGTVAKIGQHAWLDKAAMTTVGIAFFPPLIALAAVGALSQHQTAHLMMSTVERFIHAQQPDVHAEPLPHTASTDV